ncbi:MAG: 2-oxoacid:acceptor oxidoreductase subunit alpha, partial [bacterium]|nr:2-oxoacid:acceptor oxidoreductase subunit alpha [bacterium]
VSELAGKVKAMVVPEMNYGQIVLEVERCAHGKADVVFVSHGEKGLDNTVDILAAVVKAAK